MRPAALPLRVARRARDLLTTPVARTIAWAEGLELGPGARFVGLPFISICSDSQARIGADSLLCSASRGNSLGINHPVIIRTWLPGARLSIGRDVGISGATICAALRIEIGDGCLIGANAVIIDSDFHPAGGSGRRHAPNPEPAERDRVLIGDDVFIGTGAIILKGSTIGSGATIGAGAVVSGEVPPGALAVGDPARVVDRGAQPPRSQEASDPPR